MNAQEDAKSPSPKQQLKLTVEQCDCGAIAHELEDRTAQLEHEKVETKVVLHSLGEAMFVVDKDHIVRMMNPYAAELLGFASPEEAVGKPLDEVVPAVNGEGKRIPLAERSSARALAGLEHAWSASAYFIRRDGTRFPVQVTTTAISIDGQRTGAIAVFRDMTREKKIEEAKTEFIYLAAHQLRTPIATILLNVELILRHCKSRFEGSTGSEMRECRQSFADIQSSAHAVSELIDTLLNVSRIEMGTLEVAREPVNLREIIEHEVERHAGFAKQRHEAFSVEMDPQLPEIIYSDRRLLEIILQNLISNAVKYNKEGGTVSITASKQEGSLRVCVADRGIGIPHGAKDRVFERFFRAENSSLANEKGIGLGLHLVRTAVEELDGIVWFDSTPGAGSSFYVEIPLWTPPHNDAA